MIVNEEYIKSFTEKNLWQLSKDNLQSLATSMNIEFKKSETKDSLLSKIKNDDKFDLIYIYREFKNECFGLYPTEAQELLQIDNKTLKKLAKKDVLSIAYTRQQRLYGKYIDVPYYSLDSILTLSKEDLNDAIEKHCKEASEKQLAAISKARETAIRNRTCEKCGSIVAKKSDLYEGKCNKCIYEEEVLENRKIIEGVYKNFLDNKDKYVILDTETTGVSGEDEIVEIAIIDLDGNTLLNTKVFTEVLISADAYAVNGIRNEDLKGMPTIKDLNNKLSNIFNNKTILIYNEGFDTRMLYQSGFEGKFKTCCLMSLYMDYVNSDRWIGLQRAMDYEEVDIIQDHSALGDCLCCLELIKKIANK